MPQIHRFNLIKYIYTAFALLIFISCDNSSRQIFKDGYEGFVFESDPDEKDISFVPSSSEIESAEDKLMEYLKERTKNNETIFEDVFGEKIPLENRLKYYKRRYFGRKSIENQKIIKIELVFVRCGANEEWKQEKYTKEDNKECWWSVQYSIDNDEIYDFKK